MTKQQQNLIVNLRQKLHQCPEISGQEARTKALLQEFLRAHTSLEILPCGEGFYAAHREQVTEKPAIALRADYDALATPDGGAAHLCGHDGHAASLCAVALALEGRTLHRNVFLLFQPAEETGAGAYPCCELFEKEQIGSSAMAYKRNPMRSERICSLARYLILDAANASMTASVQWLERTLDDSANRRISMPEGFLCADAILRLCKNVTRGLVVNEKIIDKAVREYLPFIATENLMMEAVKRGGDRQELHEVIRRCSHAASAKMKEGEPCDLLHQLAAEPAFSMNEEDLTALLKPEDYIGRCPEQVDTFLRKVRPVLEGIPEESADIAL